MGILEKLFGDRADEFRGGALPETHVHVRGPLDRLPEVFHSGPLSSFERLCPVYRGNLQMAGGEGKDFRQVKVEGPSPEQLLRMGLTAYFFDVLGSVPQVRAVRGELGNALGIPAASIRFSAWASPDAGGLMPHFDRYDGMILQLQGKKLYRIGPCAEAVHTVRQWSPGLPLDRLDFVQFPDGAFPAPTNLTEVLLEPGSVLFLPRGYWHGTEARGVSFSVSVRFDPPICADLVLDQLRLLLLEDPEWRRPVYGAWGEGARAAAEERIERRLEGLPAAVRRLTARHAFLAVDNVADQLKWLVPETRFLRDRSLTIEADGRKARVRSTWNTSAFEVEIGPGVDAVVAWLAREDRTFALADVEARFPGVNGIRALLEGLARGGALKIMPFNGA